MGGGRGSTFANPPSGATGSVYDAMGFYNDPMGAGNQGAPGTGFLSPGDPNGAGGGAPGWMSNPMLGAYGNMSPDPFAGRNEQSIYDWIGSMYNQGNTLYNQGKTDRATQSKKAHQQPFTGFPAGGWTGPGSGAGVPQGIGDRVLPPVAMPPPGTPSDPQRLPPVAGTPPGRHSGQPNVMPPPGFGPNNQYGNSVGLGPPTAGTAEETGPGSLLWRARRPTIDKFRNRPHFPFGV